MKTKLKKEILRKLFHLYQLPVIFGYIVLKYYFSEGIAIFALAIVLMLIIELESLRLEWNVKVPDPLGLMRKHEKSRVTGGLYMIMATIIVFSVFDFKIALVALLLTVFGDLASAIIGIKFGIHRFKNGKSWEGLIAGFVVNILVAMLFLFEYPLVALTMASVASFTELTTYKLDDNLTVPLFSAFFGHIVAYALGISFIQITNPVQDLYGFLVGFL
jgi:dolichol kinase